MEDQGLSCLIPVIFFGTKSTNIRIKAQFGQPFLGQHTWSDSLNTMLFS